MGGPDEPRTVQPAQRGDPTEAGAADETFEDRTREPMRSRLRAAAVAAYHMRATAAVAGHVRASGSPSRHPMSAPGSPSTARRTLGVPGSPGVARHPMNRAGSPVVTRQGSPVVTRQGSPIVTRHPMSRAGSPVVTRYPMGDPLSTSMNHTLQGLAQALRPPTSPKQQEWVLSVLEMNPQLAAAFMKFRQAQQAQEDQQAADKMLCHSSTA